MPFSAAFLEKPECTMEIESYGFSDRDIVIKPKGDKPASIDSEAVDSEAYRVTNITAKTRTVTLSTGNYTRTKFTLNFAQV